MIVNLEKLPKDVYSKIPISIKTFKSEYELDELPFEIQHLVRKNLVTKLKYSKPVYDIHPSVSEYGDFSVLDNLFDLIHEYIKNYFLTETGNYPFNGVIGTGLKRILQKRDTTLQSLLMQEEMDRMIQTFTQSNKDARIKLKKYNLNKNKINNYVEYNLSLNIEINDEGRDMTVSFIA